MHTTLQHIHPHHPESAHIEHASSILKQGNIVAFPTETVYGLGARLSDIAAIQKIFQAKHRPIDNPLIVHVSSIAQAAHIAVVTPRAKKLMQQFWPGPLTLVLKKKASVPDIVTAGLPTVCVRMPANSVARALIKAAGEPIVAPSANTSGRPSPTTAQHVYHDLKGKIPLILDGGPCKVGLESTVLDLTTRTPRILRPGAVTYEQLKKILPNLCNPAMTRKKIRVISSPGMKYRHYAPKAKLILVIAIRPQAEKQSQGPLGLPPRQQLRSCGRVAMTDKIAILDLRQEKNLNLIARNLFSQLRDFDQQGVDVIIVYGVEEHGLGRAIMNRLRKAANYIIT